MLPLLATVAAMAAFQAGAAFAKGLFPAVGAQGAATLRLVLGALMLLALMRPWRNWPVKPPLGALAVLGAAVAGVIVFFYLALETLPLGVTIALQFMGPLAVAVVGSRKPADLAWAALAAGGVWLLVAQGHGAGHDGGQAGTKLDLVGIAWALGAAACWGAYIVAGRVVTAAFGRSTAALSIGLAAVIMLPVGVSHAGAALLDPALLPLALLVAVMSTAVPFSLEFWAMARMPARTFAVFTSLEPAFGVLSGLVLLGERLGLVQIGGVAMVMAAAAGAAWSSSEAEEESVVPQT
ncbi:EamA family transporter [Phenylobacterium sp.]|uniref:EamA family transporter n=1 Tax=Phenylobacterium sp. TaxID=1871053 RepID=UPI00391A60F2